ncbi:MAG: hypothetical protein AAB917_03300, partial [Patescibacteria group bacterium]
NIPMTYAGRLAPMAEGVLIILVGEECKEKEKYLGLGKEYEVEILLGVTTDTYDVLGLVQEVSMGKNDQNLVNFSKYVGKFKQDYPAYSSKAVGGKQLHQYAREGNLPEEMPTKEVEIYSIEKIGTEEILGEKITEKIIEKIKKVRGDFRQEEIIRGWEKFGEKYEKQKFVIIKLKVNCSSGTYMRSLANRLGAIAISIKRLQIFSSGPGSIGGSQKLLS